MSSRTFSSSSCILACVLASHAAAPPAPRPVTFSHDKAVVALAASPKGTLLASSSADGSVRVWDVKSLEQIHRIECGVAPALCFSPDGKSLFYALREQVHRHDVATGKLESTFRAAGTVTALAASPDGESLFVGGTSADLSQLGVRFGGTKRLANSPDAKSDVTSISVSEDGRLVAYTAMRRTHLYDPDKPRRGSFSTSCLAPALTAKGKLLYCGSCVSECDTHKVFPRFKNVSDRDLVLLTPDEKEVFIGGWTGGAFHDVATGARLRAIEIGKGMTCAARSPDGKELYTGSHDGVVRVWVVATAKPARR